MRTFVFGIGGTGARVMRSLAMLLAAGAKGATSGDVIIPVLIDYDLENFDTDRVRNILKNYEEIHRYAFEEGMVEVRDKFFCTRIQKLNSLQEGADIDPRADYQLFLEKADTDITFATHINYDTLSPGAGLSETRDLLDVLYDNSPSEDPNTELNLKLEKGFKGCPNIGCVVTKSLTRSRELRSFMGMLNNNDKVVIVGSIFGGTGASGIPMMLDMIRDNPRTGQVPVAVIAVTPYFNVSKDALSAIDSDTFTAKTKAALDAYDLGKSVNHQATFIYYVGDYLRNGEYSNSEGGKTQKNPAHIVELVAAEMVLDFMTVDINNEDNVNYRSLDVVAKPFEMGMKPLGDLNGVDEEIKIDRFYEEQTLIPYMYPLMRFMIFVRFCKNFVIPAKFEGRDVAIKNSGLSARQDFLKALNTFIDYFLDWVKEIQKGTTKRALNIFKNIDSASYEDLFTSVATMKKGRVWNDRYLKETDIRDMINKKWEIMKNDPVLKKAPRFFIEAMSDIIASKFDEILKKQ